MMKESPWLTFISIFGTALAISLIMTIIIAHQAMYRNMAPETARERTLYVKWVGVQDKLTESTQANGYLSLKTIRECFQSLEIPEAVSITSPAQSRLATIPGDPGERCFVLFTDDVFWKVCSFNVLKGNLYTKAEFDAGIRKVVISEKLARRMMRRWGRAYSSVLSPIQSVPWWPTLRPAQLSPMPMPGYLSPLPIFRR